MVYYGPLVNFPTSDPYCSTLLPFLLQHLSLIPPSIPCSLKKNYPKNDVPGPNIFFGSGRVNGFFKEPRSKIPTRVTTQKIQKRKLLLLCSKINMRGYMILYVLEEKWEQAGKNKKFKIIF